jgi:hypothetical protein
LKLLQFLASSCQNISILILDRSHYYIQSNIELPWFSTRLTDRPISLKTLTAGSLIHFKVPVEAAAFWRAIDAKATWDLEIVANGVSQTGGTSLTADEAIAIMDRRPDCSFRLLQRGPFSHGDNEAFRNYQARSGKRLLLNWMLQQDVRVSAASPHARE